MRIRHAVAALAIPVAVSLAATPSFAGIFDAVEHAVGGVEKTVAKDVNKVEKATVNSLEHASGDVAHAVGSVGKATAKEVGQVGKGIVKEAPKAVNLAGTVVSKTYNTLGNVAGVIPGLKEFKPLAKDAAKCAASREGKIGGAVGAGVAVATGGLSNIAIMAGAGGADGCLGKGAYDEGKKAANGAEQFVKRQGNDLRNSWRNP